MKNKLIGALTAIIFSVSAFSTPVNAAMIDFGEFPEDLIAGYATAYELTGVMASGQETHPGVCASSPDRIGDIIILYQRLPDGSVGKYIGKWECMDTGGAEAIQSGTLIDVWEPTHFDACEFMDSVYEDGCQGKVWIQVIKGEG